MQKNIRTFLRQVLVLACLLTLSSSVRAQTKPIRDLQPTVILISLDGFRYDYLSLYGRAISPSVPG